MVDDNSADEARENITRLNPTFVVDNADKDVKNGEEQNQDEVGLIKDADDVTAENELAKKSDNHKLLSAVFRFLMIGSGWCQGVAHGSNDVANAISPLLVVVGIKHRPNTQGYAIGAGGIAVGELCLGFLVMETMGKKITKIDFPKGFCV